MVGRQMLDIQLALIEMESKKWGVPLITERVFNYYLANLNYLRTRRKHGFLHVKLNFIVESVIDGHNVIDVKVVNLLQQSYLELYPIIIVNLKSALLHTRVNFRTHITKLLQAFTA